ncbi:MAG: S8 family serine peptidase, partial [Candidatus Aenigmarchaeota archaeon]|nr:S8 family serine peptidase [Candidatus Aenigmarchaeota archaeon]
MKYFISILTILAILSLSLANAQERLSGKTVAAESAESIVRNMGRSTTPLLKSPDGGYQFLAKIEDNSQLDILKKAGLNYKQCDLPGWVSFSADTAIVEALRSHIYVEPRQVLHTCEFPNDSLLADQWWFTANNGMWESDVRKAWEVTQGSADIRVGIIGTGCPLKNGVWTHPDLDSSRFVFRSVFNNAYADSDKAITDWSGHETHVEGIISAIANNGIGIAGMDQLCKLFIYKASDPYGNLNNDDIANSIYQAVHDRCNVINMSFGGSLYSRMLEDAMFYAYKAGVICVVAAGNNGGEYQSFPAFFERFTTIPGLREGLNTIVTVGSIDKNSRLSYFSNRGWFVDLYAPGGGSNLKEGVISTLPTYNFILGDSTRGYPYQRKYGYLNGTSMAAPVVTGTVSLMSAANPKLKASQVRDILVGSATRIVSTAGTVL